MVERLKAVTPPHLQDAAWCKSEPHARFVFDALKSADEDGVLLPAGNMAAMSMYMGMFIVGWAHWRDGRKGGPIIITESGRKIAALQPKE